MKELQEEISRLIKEIKYLRSEIDDLQADNAENKNLLKQILVALRSKN